MAFASASPSGSFTLADEGMVVAILLNDVEDCLCGRLLMWKIVDEKETELYDARRDIFVNNLALLVSKLALA